MTQRFCKVCRGWHDLDAPWPDNCRTERNWNKADYPSPKLIRDGMDAVWNPVDGKHYDSKSAYYDTVKKAGYEIAGNDSSISTAHERPVEVKSPSDLKEDLKAAWEQNT